MAGIQQNKDGSIFAGQINPKSDKLFVTIGEVPDFSKEYACKNGLSLRSDLQNNYSSQFAQELANVCLNNFD
jgi:hypothetical protein